MEYDSRIPIPSSLVISQEARAEQARTLKRSRGGHLGVLTKIYREIKELFKGENSHDDILMLRDKLQDEYEKFKQAHEKYDNFIDDTEEKNEAQLVFEKASRLKGDMDVEIETWIILADLNKSVSKTPQVEPDDSISQCESRSSVSSTSSQKLKLKAKAKQAKALLKLKQLEERQVLERQCLEREAKLTEIKMKLKLQEQAELNEEKAQQALLSVKHEIDQANLEVRIYEEENEDKEVTRDLTKDFVDASSKISPHSAHQIDQSKVIPDVKTQIPLAEVKGENGTPNVSNSILNPKSPEWVPDLHCESKIVNPVTRPPVSDPNVYQQSLQQLLQHQQNMMQSMANAITLPKPELFAFDGNPLNYWGFIRSFEKNIENKVPDGGERLNYLLQYCTGKARETIKNCVVLDNSIGYCTARKMLFDRFGDPYTIASSFIEQVTSGPQLKPSDREGLLAFADKLKNCKLTLEAIGYLDDINSSDNLRRIAEKLPMYMKGKWLDIARATRANGNRPTIDHLVNYVTEKAKAVNDPVFCKIMESDKGSRSGNKPNIKVKSDSSTQRATTLTTHVTSDSALSNQFSPGMSEHSKTNVSTSLKCLLCNGQHYLNNCEQFSAKSFEDRKKFLREKKLCDNCLRPGHVSRGCFKKSFCKVEGCKGKHQTLLHPTDTPITSENTKSNVGTEAPAKSYAVETASEVKNIKRVCLPIVPVKVCGKDQKEMINTYALLDRGSDTSLCDKSILNRLNLKGTEHQFTLTTVEKENSMRTGVIVDLKVMGVNSDEIVELSSVIAVDNLPISLKSKAQMKDIAAWPHLADIDLPEVNDKEVTLLIGNDCTEVFWVLEERRGGKKEPFAVRSVLGWTLSGPIQQGVDERSCNLNFLHSEEDTLQEQVERFWKTDFGDSISDQKCTLSQEDQRAKTMMEKSVVLKDGHYQIGLPWRWDKFQIPNNRSQAETRLRFLKRRLMKDQELCRMYKGAMNEYISKGYAVKSSDVQEDKQGNGLWYLPHHPVVRPDKPGNVRIVFDCAAKYEDTSLNNLLLQGPDNTNSLIGVLTRFRNESVALVADIEGMFNQVRVKPEDRDFLRFLWWPEGDLDKEPEEYQMTVHLFGATSSPSCANFALRKVAEDNPEYDKEVISTVKRNFYVDDCLKSVKSSEDAIRLSGQLRELLSKGGFRLTKWVTNRRDVLDSIPASERNKSMKDVHFENFPIERTLGMLWNVESDQFGFNIARKENLKTRRGMLSTLSSIYDPLGFAAPIILTGKKMLQEVCKAKIGWDEPIPDEIVPQWDCWLSSLQSLCDFRVNRCIKPEDFGNVIDAQLHHFSDASQGGYGAVSYLRLVNCCGDIHCSIIMGKSRLTPLKSISIPRLELSAAVVSVKLDRCLHDELELPISSSTFWTDSTTVLQYIRNESTRFHVFVANRLAIIHDATKSSQWRYVNTKENPADDISRGLTASQMLSKKRWLEGPQFLWEAESSWPEQPNGLGEVADNDPDVKREPLVFAIEEVKKTNLDVILERYSSWYQLKKTIAWLLRFSSYIKKKSKCLHKSDEEFTCGSLSVLELQEAEKAIVRYVQHKQFKDEVTALTLEHAVVHDKEGRMLYKGGVKKTSKIYKLNPVLKDGILRVGGRLGNATISEDAKHPLILPTKHHVTSLIIRHYHEESHHSGKEHVLSLIRQRYWIVKAKRAVRREIGLCFGCNKRNAKPSEQIMADLPQDRLTPDEPPFTYVGLDFFGPMLVKRARSEVKRYGCLFTCLNMRAVHIEIAHSLDTDSFLDALHRFICRRGRPKKIRCDNGTNFTAGEKELSEAIREWNLQKIDEALLQQGITWVFNPPAASNMGGVWERLIKSTRKILCVLLKNQLVNDETLLTFMAQVEAVLNSRPLTSNSDDPNDAEPLTPNHLLLLRSNPCLPPGVFNKKDLYVRRRWRQAQYLADQFWKRWLAEYVPSLQERQKWIRPMSNIRVGDVVLLADQGTVRGSWPLGIIEKVHTAPDGYVRSAKVKTASSVLTRPINKLCLLERSSE